LVDDLYDDEDDIPSKSLPKDSKAGESSKMKTPENKSSTNTGCKTISSGVMCDELDQEKLLVSHMGDMNSELLTAERPNVGPILH